MHHRGQEADHHHYRHCWRRQGCSSRAPKLKTIKVCARTEGAVARSDNLRSVRSHRQERAAKAASLFTGTTGGSAMLKGMRKYAFGAAAATALFVIPISAFSQSFEIGPGGVRVYDGRGGGQCEQLRLACENKDALGERGEGNCRRYRETCQRPARRDVCAELRQACLYKNELGEQGAGNCRRYRETCRGRL
jgi:hypothetical protein